MTGRLVASLLWLPVLLVQPLRTAFIGLSVILWPSGKLDPSLLHTPVRLVFVAAVFVVGYLLTAWAAARAIRTLRARGGDEIEVLLPHGGDRLTPIALLATVGWIVGSAFAGSLSLPLAGAAVLVVVGIVGGRETPVPPAPGPIPLPAPPQPVPEPTPAPHVTADGEDEESFLRVYAWLFNEEPFRKSGREHAFRASLVIPKALYEEFRGRPHTVRSDADYVEFANAELDDELVTEVAAHLRALVLLHGLDRLAEIHLSMAFTLAIAYAFDEPEFGGEYPKFPVETLVDKRGDCEDHAILCGAVLHRLGHRVGFVLMDTGPHVGHAALAVEAPEPIAGASFHVPALGCEMFYCEVTPALAATTETTTAAQWWLGMPPPDSASNFRVFPLGRNA